MKDMESMKDLCGHDKPTALHSPVHPLQGSFLHALHVLHGENLAAEESLWQNDHGYNEVGNRVFTRYRAYVYRVSYTAGAARRLRNNRSDAIPNANSGSARGSGITVMSALNA